VLRPSTNRRLPHASLPDNASSRPASISLIRPDIVMPVRRVAISFRNPDRTLETFGSWPTSSDQAAPRLVFGRTVKRDIEGRLRGDSPSLGCHGERWRRCSSGRRMRDRFGVRARLTADATVAAAWQRTLAEPNARISWRHRPTFRGGRIDRSIRLRSGRRCTSPYRHHG
jgi:hypothetical protein